MRAGLIAGSLFVYGDDLFGVRMCCLVSAVKVFQIFHAGTRVNKHGVQDGESGHALHDDHGTGNDDGVMAALDLNLNLLVVSVDGLLRLED